MMNKRRLLFIGASMIFLMVLVALPAFAQSGDTGGLLASEVIDRDVYQNKEIIGEVDDIIIRRSGRVKKITIEFGGFLDIGDKLVGLSFSEFDLRANGDIALEIGEEALNKKPEFKYYENDLPTDYYYRTPVGPYGPYRAYSPYGYYEPGSWHEEMPPRYHGGPHYRRQPDYWARSPERFLASAVMDRPVLGADGTLIGWLEDLLINVEKKKVEKLIVSAERHLGDNGYVALDYEPLGFTPHGISLDITMAELKNQSAYPYEE
jgi:hypothetical protein